MYRSIIYELVVRPGIFYHWRERGTPMTEGTEEGGGYLPCCSWTRRPGEAAYGEATAAGMDE